MTPPKSEVFKAIRGFMGAKKVFRDPPKSKKLIFSKNPNSVICPNMGGGQGSGPSHPEGVGPLGLIR